MNFSGIIMFGYLAYWIFLGVIVVKFEKRIGALEKENSELKKAVKKDEPE